MKNEHVAKLMNVWNSKNKILQPSENKIITEIIDNIAALFSAGNFYYFVFNFATYNMDYVSKGTNSVLGIASKDFSLEKFLNLLLPEDLKKIHEKERASLNFKLDRIPKEDILKYKTVYILRVKLNDGTQKTLLHQTKVLNLSNDDKIHQVLSIHTDVSHLNIPIDHKISFISDEKTSYYSIDTKSSIEIAKMSLKTILTKRETEIIREFVKGKNNKEISEALFISIHTVNTHKRNILKKSNCKNTSQLIAKCINDGVI